MQVIDAVARAGMQHQVIVKTEAGIFTAPLAAMPPFNTVYFFPILINAHGTADLAAIATAQARNAHPMHSNCQRWLPRNCRRWWQ